MKITLEETQLRIELEWYEQLWAFTLNNVMEIPFAHMIRATTEEPQSNWMEIRAPGTFLPGVIKAGTYYTKEGREFWYVTGATNYLTLELQDEPFKRIIVTTPDSQALVEQINQKCSHP